jgi:hypothetical protein
MGVGPRKHLAGLAGIEDETRPEDDGDAFVIEAREDDGWQEVQRTASQEAAEEALDELAATRGIDLGDLRVRQLD